MKKIRKRIFAVALAAVMLFHVPGTASYAEQVAADMEIQKCICELLCTEDSINDGCPLCGVEGADLSACEGTACKGGEDEEEQEQVDISCCMELQEELDAANIPALAEGEVSVGYQKAEWNGNEVVYSDETADCILVTDSAEAVTWNAGWYVVNSNVTIEQPITVSGAVNLILADGCTLDAAQGIVVTESNSLTIYAQAGGNGKLNATGVHDNSSDNASAGIGGSAESPNSGSVTIHGGVIHATGGGGNNGAAGIGGGAVDTGNGGNSGAITIYGGTVTADSGQADVTGAGIGGGAGNKATNNVGGNGGTGSGITIYGGIVTAASHGNSGGAGIGGGVGGYKSGGAGSHIHIYDGTVKATGDTRGAGIGGGSGAKNGTSGAGSNITISGGIVTAVGGKYAAGIGGGGGYIGGYNNTAIITGGTGTSISITGGIVDAQGGAGNSSGLYAGEPIGSGGNAQGTAGVTKTTGIVFENGAGFVYGDVTFMGTYAVPAAYTLTISTEASLSGSGTLTGGSAYLIEGLSADMISVPEGWHYTKDDMSEDIKEQVGLNGDVTICGQTFKADTDGWELSVTKESDLKYIVKYTHTDGTVVSKDVILTQAQTTLSGVAVYKADGTTPANTFGADETFIVKATPEILANAIMKTAAFTAPSERQMALFVGDTQVSEPVGASADGDYTMTVKAFDVLELGNMKPNGDPITLNAKFVGNGNMADAAGTVAVNITAEAEVNGTLYPTLKKVFEDVSSGTFTGDVAITLLRDIDLTGQLSVESLFVDASTPEIHITLELNGKTISAPETALYVSDSRMTLTIQDSSAGKTGNIRGGSSNSYLGTGVHLDAGTLYLTGGNFLGNLYGVNLNKNNFSPPTLEVSGDAVIQGTGQDGYGLNVSNTLGSVNIRLSGGTFTGGHRAISADNGNTLKNLLAEGQGDVCYAYFDGDTPTTKDLNASSSSYKSITVKPCTHIGEGICEYQSSADALTHSKTCLACGMVWDAEDCKYTFEGHTGTCGNCKSTITLSLQNADNLIYDGTEKKPGVTLTRGGEIVAEGYSVAYSNHTDAGDNTASVTVTIGSNQGTYTETFSIGRATPAITWNSTSQTVNYTGRAAKITAPTVTLVNGETYAGEISYSYTGTSSGTGLPTNAGIYTIKAGIAEQGNYTAAETSGTLTLTIDRAEGKLTVPENSISKTFGDGEFSLNCSTNGDGKITYVSSNKDVASVSAAGNVLITGVGETVVTATLAEGTNHTGGANQEITVTVTKADAPAIIDEIRYYTYISGSKGAVIIDVAEKLPSDRGETKYTYAAVDADGILSDLSVDDKGKLSYTVQGDKETGNTASVRVTAEMANYDTTVFTVEIKIVEKIPVNITAEPENSVYDGSPHKGVSGLMADGGYIGSYLYEYKGTGETDYSGSEPPVRAGSYTVSISVADSEYEGSSSEIPFVIEKASVSIRADDKSAETGSTIPELTYTVSGLAGTERLAKEPQLSCSADMDRAGVYPITVSGAKVPDTDNYEESIVYAAGNLTVTAKSTGSGSGTGSSGNTGSSGGTGSSGNTGSSGGMGSSGNAGSTDSGTKQPFLKDSSGRKGWDVIRAEAEKVAAATEDGTVAVDMNGASVVPGSIFAKIRDKDVTIAFDMGGGFVWSVNGKDVTAETISDTDFSVKAGTGYIPQNVAAGASGGLAYLELRLAHDGPFGFAASLSIRITEKGGGIAAGGSGGVPAGYTGMYANLFYYNPDLRSLEFVSAAKIAGDGTVSLPFVHASDYAVILSAEPMGTVQESSGADREDPSGGQQPSGTDLAEGTGRKPQVKSVRLSKTVYTYSGKAKKPSVTVTGTDGKRIPAKYYTVSYNNNKLVGKAAVTVRFKGIYSGTVKKTFTIRPAGTSIRKLAAVSGGFHVKWKIKTVQTDGYQIQYSTDSRFKGSSTDSIFVKSGSLKKSFLKNASGKKVSVGKHTVKKLKAGKQYYVRVRTYKTVKSDGKSTKIYSAWSSADRVKTPAAGSFVVNGNLQML